MSTNPAFALSESEEASWQAMASNTPAEAPENSPETPPEIISDDEIELSDGADDAPKEKERPKFVPHQALHEERERRKTLEKDLQASREREARFDERFKMLQEMNRQPEPEQKSVLDDPVGALERLTQEREQERRQAAERKAGEDAWNDFTTAYAGKVAEFKQSQPDFDDAYAFLSNHRFQELIEAGYHPAQAKAQATQDEANIVWQAMQSGTNPGEILLKLAKHRGWAKKAPASSRSSEEQIDKIADAKARNGSFTGSGGHSATDEMTGERLARMSNADFDAWTTKNPAKFKRLAGG